MVVHDSGQVKKSGFLGNENLKLCYEFRSLVHFTVLGKFLTPKTPRELSKNRALVP